MGNRLPRKLAAILYADVAGYSRLTGDDEDATHKALSEYVGNLSYRDPAEITRFEEGLRKAELPE